MALKPGGGEEDIPLLNFNAFGGETMSMSSGPQLISDEPSFPVERQSGSPPTRCGSFVQKKGSRIFEKSVIYTFRQLVSTSKDCHALQQSFRV